MHEAATPTNPPDPRVAVLVVRAWAAGPLPEGLRARITRTLDVSTGEEVTSTATDAETILATVRAWLDEFTSG